MNVKSRLSKIEKRVKTDNYLPVLIVDDRSLNDRYREKIGPNTVVFIDDIGDE